MEIWKEIAWAGGALEISSLGRVKSHLRDGRILRQQADNKGYMRIRVTLNREKMSLKIHREVAKAFLPNPRGLEQVNHKDGNKQNNRVSNLEWICNAENAHHAIENGLWANTIAASRRSNEARKTPIYAIDSTTGARQRFDSVSAAEHFYNNRHISDALNGKRARAAGQYFVREGVC